MKHTSASLFLTAAILCTACLTACGDHANTAASVTNADTEPVTEITTESHLKASIPDELDFGGETLNILYCPIISTYNINQTEDSGDNVESSIYQANQAVMEQLNCTFSFIEGGTGENTLMKNSILADDNAFDTAYAVQWLTISMILDQMLYNLEEAPYLDLEKPWWNAGYNEEAAAPNGQKYILAGDLNLNTLRKASVLVMNTDLMTDKDLNSDDVIKQILDGNWTWDSFSSMTRDVYSDVNGDSQRDAGDTYGIACTTRSIIDHIVINSGIRMTERNAEHIPEIIFNNEKTLTVVENITELFHNNAGMFYMEGCSFPDFLAENRVLFLPILLSSLESYRDIETNYAVIPMPKLDETIDHYSALVHDDTTIVCVPNNCRKTDLTFAALELLAYEGYYRVMPEYYNISMKQKYLRGSDDTAVQLIDLIHDSITTDFGYVYNYEMGSVIVGLRDCALQNSFNFSSFYASVEKKMNKQYTKLLEAMEKD